MAEALWLSAAFVSMVFAISAALNFEEKKDGAYAVALLIFSIATIASAFMAGACAH